MTAYFLTHFYVTLIHSVSSSSAVKQEPGDPCVPSPCGPNSQCRNVNGQGVCSCLPNYIGSPPGCRPECVVSSECPQNRACVNQKCVDPCPGTCGLNARCEVINHSPICSCQVGFTGDPFTRCNPIPRKWMFFLPEMNMYRQRLLLYLNVCFSLFYSSTCSNTDTSTIC